MDGEPLKATPSGPTTVHESKGQGVSKPSGFNAHAGRCTGQKGRPFYLDWPGSIGVSTNRF